MEDEPEMPGCSLPPLAVLICIVGSAVICGGFKLAAAVLRATMGAG